MQSTSVASLPHSTTPAKTGSFYTEKLYREQNDLTIQYSGRGGDLYLNMSTDIFYTSSLYTEEGYLSSQIHKNEHTQVISSSDTSETDTAKNTSDTTQLYNIAPHKYYNLVREQVAYLLGEISSWHDDTPFGPEENSSKKVGNAATVNGTVMYSESYSVSQSLEISGTITDTDYFSAEQTAERIISFALSFYDGGDREAYAEMVRVAVMDGFNEALAAFGGFLPQVSYDTINLVNQAIEQFSSGSGINISA